MMVVTDERKGAIATRLLDDGNELVLYPMLFGNTRLCLGPAGAPYYDRGWCFHDTAAALRAVAVWEGEGDPEGFYKRVGES